MLGAIRLAFVEQCCNALSGEEARRLRKKKHRKTNVLTIYARARHNNKTVFKPKNGMQGDDKKNY